MSRGYVMTRGGLDASREQLFASASRHGLGEAADILVVADVAEALHGAGAPAALAGLTPLLAQLDAGQAPRLLEDLRAALAGLAVAPSAQFRRPINYLAANGERLDYADGKRRGEPLGSGAMESPCWQDPCRIKHPGQFWTQTGDEALLWRKPSGATPAGKPSSPTSAPSPRPRIEMRP